MVTVTKCQKTEHIPAAYLELCISDSTVCSTRTHISCSKIFYNIKIILQSCSLAYNTRITTTSCPLFFFLSVISLTILSVTHTKITCTIRERCRTKNKHEGGSGLTATLSGHLPGNNYKYHAEPVDNNRCHDRDANPVSCDDF